MLLKYIFLCCFTLYASGAKLQCNYKNAVTLHKKSTYDFSVRILDRVVDETSGHFVFSPISTWWQLVTLAEGAKGRTLEEIRRVTKHHRKECFRRKLKLTFNEIGKELKKEGKRTSVVIVERLVPVKNRFKRELMRLRGVKFMSLYYGDMEHAADRVNKYIASETNGVISDVSEPIDFNSTAVILKDATFFYNLWDKPFNPSRTTRQAFYTSINTQRQVDMMNQISYFHYADLALIDAQVLELPCANKRYSMLIFLPKEGSVKDLFYYLKRTRLSYIYNTFSKQSEQLVNVSLPKFSINTTVDNLPELVNDMGVRRMFYPHLAELSGISDYTLFVSVMSQATSFDVNEYGVKGSTVENLVKGDHVDFNVNRPFGFMIADRNTEFILYAGIYSNPPL